MTKSMATDRLLIALDSFRLTTSLDRKFSARREARTRRAWRGVPPEGPRRIVCSGNFRSGLALATSQTVAAQGRREASKRGEALEVSAMCNDACIEFAVAQLQKDDVQGKRVLEVGACDVNGSVRSLVEALGPAGYLGVDLEEGPGVDEVCRAEDLVRRYGPESFDVVISTEMLEHARNWRTVISNLKRVVAPGGVLLLTTRSNGFGFHAYPFDFWRYEMTDMEVLFSDFRIEALSPDRCDPGVLFKGRKPSKFQERDLSAYPLYSMMTGGRAVAIHNREILVFRARYLARRAVIHVLPARGLLPGPIRRALKRLLGF